MKNFYWSVIDIVTESDFNERVLKTKQNIKYLRLSVIQSKKYYEAVAVLHRTWLVQGIIPGNSASAKLMIKYYKQKAV